MFVFGQISCIRSKLVEFGLIGCIREGAVVLGQRCCIREKLLFSNKSGYNRTR